MGKGPISPSEASNEIVGADFVFWFTKPVQEIKCERHLSLREGGRKKPGLQQLTGMAIERALAKSNSSTLDAGCIHNVDQNVRAGAKFRTQNAIMTKNNGTFSVNERTPHGIAFQNDWLDWLFRILELASYSGQLHYLVNNSDEALEALLTLGLGSSVVLG